ncbi:hypothetical protein ACFQ9Z_34430 [Streptomyces sp. NPDC056580]|uniref:hypothetical protein n=1 Tax=Streptomyces sp. NPDC056580 TaxID=3345872 RepID=UPI00368972EF
MHDPTHDYLERCRAEHGALRSVVDRLDLPPRFRAAYDGRLTSRPFFARESVLQDLARDLAALYDLLTSVPERMYDGDVGRYAEALNIPPAEAALMRRVDDHRPPLHARADLYRDGDSFTLLELNIGSQLGGIDLAEMSRALLRDEEFAHFADRHDLRHGDQGAELVASVREAAEAAGVLGDPTVALVEADGTFARYPLVFAAIEEMLLALGLRVLPAELGEVSTRDGRVRVRGERVDVVLRFFSPDQISRDQDALNKVHELLSLHERGAVVLFTPPEHYLYSNKGTFALLSAARSRGLLARHEQLLVDRLLPWTHLLTEDRALVEGQDVDALDYCREHRADLIVKPAADFAGNGVVAGWECGPREWTELLRDRRSRGGVVQRRVVPCPEYVVDPRTGETTELVGNWGVYLTHRGLAGSHVRAQPAGSGAVISFGGNTATTMSPVMYA